jgi:hypothetical protein
MLPPGFSSSSLAITSTSGSGNRRWSVTTGVFPTQSKTDLHTGSGTDVQIDSNAGTGTGPATDSTGGIDDWPSASGTRRADGANPATHG